MNFTFNKKFMGLLFLSSVVVSVWAEPKSLTVWHSEFSKLSSGMSRVEAEKEIAKVRQVKSTYDLWAMDTSSSVAYLLDQQTILLVRYKPGAPAPRIIDKSGQNIHLPPIDGSLIEYEILRLK